MEFAMRLIELRRREGLSQEELADRLGVSRQAVSKWESGQSMPDVDRLVELADMFKVSVDYLLRGGQEDATRDADADGAYRVGLQEAEEFMAMRERTAAPLAWGTLLCVASPACLLVLLAMCPSAALSPTVAVGAGVAVLLALVAAACGAFMWCHGHSSRFEHLAKEPFEAGRGVAEAVHQRREAFRPAYSRGNLIGVCLCVAAVIPLFVGIMLDEGSGVIVMCMVAALLVIAGAGVWSMVRVGAVWAAHDALLQQGEYSRARKATQRVRSAIVTAYWLAITALYMGTSFITGSWDRTWLIWALAGVLYPAVMAVCDARLSAK